MNDARRHVRSARALADDDTPLAMAACHDAIRKAITAHMLANGLRPRGGKGAHRIVLDYARSQLGGLTSEGDLEEAKEIRQDRAFGRVRRLPLRQLDGDHVRGAAEVAERIVNAVAHALAEQGRSSGGRRR